MHYHYTPVAVLGTDATVITLHTRNSSADERANVNFLYDYIVHALGNKKEKDKTNS